MAMLIIYSTLKQGCSAGIKLWLSEDRQFLTVTDVAEDHNHEVDKVRIAQGRYTEVFGRS